jgi:site-specific DNA-methyltransferase (adenine-specific)
MLKLNKIYNLDCLKGLQKIDDKSVDLIITSPPFNLGNTHHTGFKKHKSYNDKMPEEEYQLWQLKVLNECFRVLKDNGSLLYQHKNRISKGIQISPYEWIYKSNFLIKQEIVWINRSQNFDKIRFYPFTERVYWLAKDSKTKLHNKINKQDVFDWKEWKPVGTKGIHTRAFPEKLVEDFLNVFPKAKLVLDPFIGSGTVAVVCKKMKKNFIGFEKNKEFVMYSNKRLKQL